MGRFSGEIQQIQKTGFYIQKKNECNKGKHQKEIFRMFNILPLACQHLLPSIVVENMEKI
jgi:hypothetical protein